jgi:hypothetical protein
MRSCPLLAGTGRQCEGRRVGERSIGAEVIWCNQYKRNWNISLKYNQGELSYSLSPGGYF